MLINKQLKKEALSISIYSHKVSNEEPRVSIELKELDIEIMIDEISKNPTLTNFKDSHQPIIKEILETLKNNKEELMAVNQKYIGFYHNGILILRFKFENYKTEKEWHISIHRYKNKKTTIEKEIRTNRIMVATIAGSMLFSSFIFGLSYLKNNNK